MLTGGLSAMSVNPMRLCKRFGHCNVPICPVDSLKSGIRLFDEHEKCTLSQADRRKLRRAGK